MFAEGEVSSAGWVAAAIATLSAIGTLVVTVMNAKHRNKQESDQNALAPLREALDRQQRELERREIHEQDLMKAFDQISEEQIACQVALVDLYGEYVRVHDHLKRLAAAVKACGQDPGDLPQLRERPVRVDRKAIEFRSNTLKQQSKSISDSSTVSMSRPPPLPPDTRN